MNEETREAAEAGPAVAIGRRQISVDVHPALSEWMQKEPGESETLRDWSVRRQCKQS